MDSETKKAPIEYIFKDGTREQKRELIGCLNKIICIKQKRIYCEPEKSIAS